VLPMSKLEENAKALEAPFEKMGIKARSLLSQVSTERDWPASTKVLTDQYSPSNILNAR
jgi:spermidine synthase